MVLDLLIFNADLTCLLRLADLKTEQAQGNLVFNFDLTKLPLMLMMLNYVKLIVLLIAVFFILRMLFSLFLPHNV